ncbi:MAG: phosphoglycerate dehydrogenase, partial [Deltaproteobacteria bacterium]|nr:phosphoglycerate dehydrogenase [Deltaproteobacteria bacterium]
VGIIGVGRIGQNVAKRLGSWGMKILGYDPYVKQETVASLGVKMVSLEELLREADVVTLHVVLTRETRGMIGMAQFRLMKPSAFIINTSRGPAIVENDLNQALRENIIAGAALDVFTEEPTPMTNPLRQIDPERVILTPHTIGTNPGSQSAGQKMAAESILAILDGKIPDTVVNPLAIPRWKERFLSWG